MKKIKVMGRYTAEAGKALKSSERVICRVTEDGAIYVSNGYFAYKMTAPEYTAVVQPVTCCEAGNWMIDKDGKHNDGKPFDLEKCYKDAVNAASSADYLERCPLDLDIQNGPAACYYNAAASFAAFYNSRFIAALHPSAKLRAPGAISAAVAYIGDEPFCIVLPIKPDPKAARAVKAYFTENDNAAADKLRANLDAARNEITKADSVIEQLREQIAQQAAELEALHNAQQNQAAATEPKTAAELIVSRFAGMAGVTATIKGAQTAAPVVWLSGDTDKHADAIKAAGAKWSHKKSAFYVRVA